MVHRHPTARELGSYLSMYSVGLFVESSPECAVCESDLTKDDTIVCLPCKHLFHPNCIIPWIKRVGHTSGIPLMISTILVLYADRHCLKWFQMMTDMKMMMRKMGKEKKEKELSSICNVFS